MSTLVKLFLIWFAASIGYYYIIPIFGFALSYNTEPLATAVYYASFSVFTFLIFKIFFIENLKFDVRLWFYPFLIFVLAILVATFLYSYFSLDQLYSQILVKTFSAYVDMVLANNWYFIPKFFEVLFQDLLITILILEIYRRYGSVYQVQFVYVCLFGGAHILQLYFTNTEVLYSTLLLVGAVLSTFLFPKLILNVRGGFVYLFTIHFLFYVFLAMYLHLFPPGGFSVFGL